MTGEVWLVSGIPGAGKSTTAHLLAQSFARGVHIEADLLQGWIVGGGVWPGDEPEEESRRQIRLSVRNQCLLARSFAEAGFMTVIDYVIADPGTHLSQLGGLTAYFVVLAPGRQAAIERDRTRPKSVAHAARHGISIAERFAHLEEDFESKRGRGLWLDTREMTASEAVAEILRRREEALVQAGNRTTQEDDVNART